MQALADIRKLGPVLAGELHRYGYDPSDVLSIVHCADGWGGPTNIRPAWHEARVRLQKVAIELRAGKEPTPADAPATGGAKMEEWSPPRGYVSVKDIENDPAWQKRGKNPARTTIQTWENSHPTDRVKDPASQAVWYPRHWVFERWTGWNPRQRNTST